MNASKIGNTLKSKKGSPPLQLGCAASGSVRARVEDRHRPIHIYQCKIWRDASKDFVQIGSHCSIYSISTIDEKSGKVTLKKNCKVGAAVSSCLV
jgi:hypothetical protein